MASLTCVRCFYYILNAFYFVLALELFALGIWVAVEPAVKTVVAEAQFPVGYILIGIGVAMLIIAILAFIAACKMSSCLLMVTFVGYVLSLIALTAIIIWVAISREKVKESVDTVLGNCVKEYVSSSDQLSTCSVLLDAVQNMWVCCGRNGYSDYALSGIASTLTGGSPKYPESCGAYNSNPLMQVTENLVRQGCSPVVQKSIDERYAVILGVAGAQLIFPLVLCILSMVMYRLLKTAGFAPVRT